MMLQSDEAQLRAAIKRLEGTGDKVPVGAREAAVAVLLTGKSLADYSVLLMRRAYRESDRWAGQISLPGGHSEESDEDLVATARRESVEEVGVDPLDGAKALHLGALPSIQARASAERLALFITPIVFYKEAVPPPVCGPEAAEAFWLPMHAAHKGDFNAEHRFEKNGVIHKLPSWRYEDRTIWGMTHGILHRFFTSIHAE